MSGILTNGLPLATALVGTELIPVDTGNTAGILPESEAVTINQIVAFAGVGNVAVATPDNGTTQTLTAAMVTAANAALVSHLSTGGATPTLTLPTTAQIIAALPNVVNGYSYVLRVINANSGTATLAAGTGGTISGTATLTTNTTRDFAVVLNTAAGTVAFTSIGTGTYS